MKYGIREICDVVLKAKSTIKVGNKTFAKGEPVIYFDSLKTSTMEGAATTVYAQGGRGNSRLVAWEGERTVTFTMEDALISELGLAVLTGAGIIDDKDEKIIVHTTGKAAVEGTTATLKTDEAIVTTADVYAIIMNEYDDVLDTKKLSSTNITSTQLTCTAPANSVVLFDFYIEKANTGSKQIEITADKFAGNYYLEASTLFRSADGVDHPAEFIIPNCKIQSNFTFSMASSGDPSTFTFTMDAFPDYTKFDLTKKVLSVIQVLSEDNPVHDIDNVDLSKVTINVAGPTALVEGETATLTAAVNPTGANGAVEWVSSKPDVATVNYNGVVTALSAGSTTITAKSRVYTGKQSAAHTITVTAAGN